ncbi:uncharacterized protein LOC125218676 isoform X2 [Salvia hispanica]|uniref:uncharacterized protein LOC125218676 isoform X2 n=1 Tax=Salvia hispanica TaxID=49212 RepID=UPI0020099664|nr:uncharacterized protein LOC125218676 isoform X2 [Salvia hispanica]
MESWVFFLLLKCLQQKENPRIGLKGKLETKPIQSVNKSVMRDCIIHMIVPAIKAKWSEWACKEIYTQQDNATPHIYDVDAEFEAVAICQPPNSPDTNILDLGFFRAIQTLQHEKPCNSVDTLLEKACLTEIMVFRGVNN